MSDNEPDRIESATHNTFQKKMDIEIKILRVMSPTEFKMQPTIHFQKKVGYFRVNLNFFFFLEMYCGLHFQFHQAHYYHSSNVLYITLNLQ
jgi:hypothetical protein